MLENEKSIFKISSLMDMIIYVLNEIKGLAF